MDFSAKLSKNLLDSTGVYKSLSPGMTRIGEDQTIKKEMRNIGVHFECGGNFGGCSGLKGSPRGHRTTG